MSVFKRLSSKNKLNLEMKGFNGNDRMESLTNLNVHGSVTSEDQLLIDNTEMMYNNNDTTGFQGIEDLTKNIIVLQQQLNDYKRITLTKLNVKDDRISHRKIQRHSSLPIETIMFQQRLTTLPEQDNINIINNDKMNISDTKKEDFKINEFQQEIIALRKEMESTKRDMMNEIHTTRYDILKEVTMLKGAVLKLVAAMEIKEKELDQDQDSFHEENNHLVNQKMLHSGDRIVAPNNRNKNLVAKSLSMESKIQGNPVIPYLPSKKLQRTSSSNYSNINEIKESNGNDIKNELRETIQILPEIAEDALTNGLNDEYLQKYLPYSNEDKKNIIIKNKNNILKGTREWVASSFSKWIERSNTILNTNHENNTIHNDRFFGLFGSSGTGKTSLMVYLYERYKNNIIYNHFCRFDEKYKSEPCRIILEIANQLAKKIPLYRNQLARLNLPYVVEEADPSILFTKLLINPLNNIPTDTIHESQIIMIDGIDESYSMTKDVNNKKDLIDVLTECSLELPNWINFIISSSNENKKVLNNIPFSSFVYLDGKDVEIQSKNDSRLMIQKIISEKVYDKEYEEAINMIQEKSNGGNFLYLNFTLQAFENSNIEGVDGKVDLETIQELPDGLYDVYEDIFEEKYGKGRRRLWAKVSLLLELIVAAIVYNYGFTDQTKGRITETIAKEILDFSRDDLNKIKRSFQDIIKVINGEYRIIHYSLLEWLTNINHNNQNPFQIDVMNGLQKLKKYTKLNDDTITRGSGNGCNRVSSSTSSTISESTL